MAEHPAAPRMAAVQMCSSAGLQENLQAATELVARAVDGGAELVVLPEYFPFMGMRERDKYPLTETAGSGPIQELMAELAQRHHCWLVGGSIPVQSSDARRPFGRCNVYTPDGSLAGSYDKMYLFDVDVADNMRSYRESATCMPGGDTVVVDTPWGGLGLAICYDLRFPELFRRLVDQGATMFAIPAAFTATTGAAHWQLLLRARAVENLCFVIAAAQGGEHQNGRSTWGHSSIIDPWGERLIELDDTPGCAVAEIDFEEQSRLRREFPVLSHRRC